MLRRLLLLQALCWRLWQTAPLRERAVAITVVITGAIIAVITTAVMEVTTTVVIMEVTTTVAAIISIMATIMVVLLPQLELAL